MEAIDSGRVDPRDGRLTLLKMEEGGERFLLAFDILVPNLKATGELQEVAWPMTEARKKENAGPRKHYERRLFPQPYS